MQDDVLQFQATIWIYPGPTPWHFVTLPKDQAEQIRFFYPRRVGFGAVKVEALIGETRWQTSIFPDKKSGSYFLPLKAEVRKKEKLNADETIGVSLRILQPTPL